MHKSFQELSIHRSQQSVRVTEVLDWDSVEECSYFGNFQCLVQWLEMVLRTGYIPSRVTQLAMIRAGGEWAGLDRVISGGSP